MTALDFLMGGRFEEAIVAYQKLLEIKSGDLGSMDGLASALMGAGRFKEAIPPMLRVHEADKAEIPDHPGQHLYLATAYWCLEDRARAIELARGLCAGILDRTVNMAPDFAGGATFGLVLHYMAMTAADDANRDYALRYLQKLNVKFNKRPTLFHYPVATVKQLLGELSFEDALESAAGTRDLEAAFRAAGGNRSVMLRLGIVLFHDGAIHRANGDEAGCKRRMKEVFHLGYKTDSVRWYLARHEVNR
jgi:tetratricopeptide (TPR) repeat protein